MGIIEIISYLIKNIRVKFSIFLVDIFFFIVMTILFLRKKEYGIYYDKLFIWEDIVYNYSLYEKRY